MGHAAVLRWESQQTPLLPAVMDFPTPENMSRINTLSALESDLDAVSATRSFRLLLELRRVSVPIWQPPSVPMKNDRH